MKTFRWGFYGAALLTLLVGVYLVRLWSPERQIELHTNHLLRSLERRDWQELSSFFATDYQDQWGQDRALALGRARQVFGYLRGIELKRTETGVRSSGRAGSWDGRIELAGANNSELASIVKERLNNVRTPFRLDWRQQSGKPWDWQLVRVANDELNLPAGNEYMP